jgi:hypothetical protein
VSARLAVRGAAVRASGYYRRTFHWQTDGYLVAKVVAARKPT